MDITRALRPNTFHKFSLALFISFWCSFAAATMYTWVDDKGVRHYSDKVPTKYKDQATPMGSQKTNVMKSTKVPKVSHRYKKPKPAKTQAKSKTPRGNKRKQRTPNISQSQYAKMNCKQQWSAYKQSEQCYNKCAGSVDRTTYVSRGSVWEERSRDMSGCGHCVDLKKPDCDKR